MKHRIKYKTHAVHPVQPQAMGITDGLPRPRTDRKLVEMKQQKTPKGTGDLTQEGLN